jgi:phosphate butyryltransferase
MIKNLNGLLEAAKKQETMKLVVAAAQDEDVLLAVAKAAEESLIEPVLVGDEVKINAIAKEHNLDLSKYELIHIEDLVEVAKTSVELVKTGKADFVMKGLIDTSILLKAVLDKEVGLRTDSQLSHVMVYDIPAYHKLMFFTDGGMNIAPDLAAKTAITKNAIQVAKALGNKEVKVAALAAKEKVNPKMPATVDADALKQKCVDGEFGEGVIVEGPLAFDLIVSKEAAETKGFKSQIAGDVDVVVVPTIEVGNGIGKSLTYLSNAKSAGIIMGAKAPVVLVSRADSFEDKLNSIALGSVIAAYK